MDLLRSCALTMVVLCAFMSACAQNNNINDNTLQNDVLNTMNTVTSTDDGDNDDDDDNTSSPTKTPEPESTPDKDAVLKLQKRLAELDYMNEDDITGIFDTNTINAVKLFQREAGLPETGTVDDDFNDELYDENTPKYVEFSKCAPTINMEFSELVGDNGVYGYPEGYPEPDTYSIIVDIEHQVTMVYKKDENGNYTVPVRYMLCSTGANDCTPKGTFDMDSYRVRFSRFVRDGRFGQYWTQIRKAIYFHTILYTELNAAAYQEDIFELLGTPDSHGCVRLTVPDARWMWYNIAPGTKCLIRDGSKDDKRTEAIRKRLTLNSPPEKHLDLKPGEIPCTDNWRIEEVPHNVPFVQGSQY